MMKQRGITLVEMLVLVAIGALLCSVAVPNLLKAQGSSKVARMEDSLRKFDIAVESYRIDHGVPQPTLRRNGMESRKWMFARLSAPVAYLQSALPTSSARKHGQTIVI